MTFKILLKSFSILEKLFQLSFNVEISYSLYKILKVLQEELKFYEQEEKKLIDKYTQKSKGKDQLLFLNDDAKNNFFIELEKLQNTKINIQFSKISIPLKSIKDISLSPQDFYLLEDIIDFEEEENDNGSK